MQYRASCHKHFEDLDIYKTNLKMTKVTENSHI